jgi:glutamate 5-kinase
MVNKKVVAALGQCALMSVYTNLFSQYGIKVAQVRIQKFKKKQKEKKEKKKN